MKYLKAKITRSMINYFGNDDRRIEHALHVLLHAEQLASNEADPEIVIAAALLHDIGIKLSEEKLGYNNGRTQEEFGPPVAAKLLNEIGFDPRKTKIVCDIIGNHHSKSRFDYPELEILKQADKIVNIYEAKLENS
jgi:putative nucleotidyltransferase with HDIG domain